MRKTGSSPLVRRARALIAFSVGGLLPAAATAETTAALPACQLTHTLSPQVAVTGEVYYLNSETSLRGLYKVELAPTFSGEAAAPTLPHGNLIVSYHWTQEQVQQYRMDLHNPLYKPTAGVQPSFDVIFDIGGATHVAHFYAPASEWLPVSGWTGGNSLPQVASDVSVTFKPLDEQKPGTTFTYGAAGAREAFTIAPQVFGALVDYASKGECKPANQYVPTYDDSLFYDDPYGDCFITTATCGAVGLSDDCWELSTLRRFRDGWLAGQDGGAEDIARYYREAPAVAARLKRDRKALLRLYWTRIVPSALAASIGANRLARQIYTRMMGELGVA